MINISKALTIAIIDNHYNKLCKKSPLKRLRNYFDELLFNRSLTSKQYLAINYLKNHTLHPKKSILINNIEYLNEFKINYEKNFGCLLNEKIQHKGKEILLRKYLEEHVFYYKDYNRWDAYDLAQSLNINVCPYCNRIPTYTIGTSHKKGVRPQFDHFFDKARYPYLSLSIYNLIPCCSICNSSYKGTTPFNLIDHYHPYQKGFDCNNIKFTLLIKDIDDFLSTMSAKLDIPEYEIAFITSSNITMPKNIKDFGLIELYNYDKNYTNELIKKSFIYDNTYIENLYSDYEGTLFSSKEEIKNLVIGNYLNITDINNRPLGKLTKDIVEELGIF
ncbi:hypothetical protein [Myroides odoratus]|uniref:hypothetical protein n=1 Tax=Myroides odoratus TaxID=256 RepID=UPI00333EA49A